MLRDGTFYQPRTPKKPPHDTTRVDEGHRGTPQGHTIALSQPVERAVTWLVHHDDRKLRYRGTIANDAWLHARAAALKLRQLINLGLTHTGRTWRLTPAST